MHYHKHLLREISKFASGLVAADFLTGFWFHYSNALPISFLGIVWGPSAVFAWMIFDIFLFLILIHYGWQAEIHTPSPKQKSIFLAIGIITGVISLVHLVRVIFGVSVDIGGWEFPYWLSWIAVVVAGYISYTSFGFYRK